MPKGILRNFFLYSSILLLSISLAGCPAPMTNKMSLDKNAKLPYESLPNQALVYITQPYTNVDWVFPPLGTLSEGATYYSSKIFIKSNTNPDYAYIGKMNTSAGPNHTNLCFYVEPGTYTIRFTNPGAIPAELQKNLNLTANSIHILGLNYSSYSGGTDPKLDLQELDNSVGKGYIAKSPTPQCSIVNNAALSNNQPIQFLLSLTIYNRTPNYLIVPKRSTPNNQVISISPGGNYSVETSGEMNTQEFLKTGFKLHTRYTQLFPCQSAVDCSSLFSHTDWLRLTVGAYASFPENKALVSVTNSDPGDSLKGDPLKIRASGNCKIEKTATVVKTTCIAEVEPDSAN